MSKCTSKEYKHDEIYEKDNDFTQKEKDISNISINELLKESIYQANIIKATTESLRKISKPDCECACNTIYHTIERIIISLQDTIKKNDELVSENEQRQVLNNSLSNKYKVQIEKLKEDHKKIEESSENKNKIYKEQIETKYKVKIEKLKEDHKKIEESSENEIKIYKEQIETMEIEYKVQIEKLKEDHKKFEESSENEIKIYKEQIEKMEIEISSLSSERRENTVPHGKVKGKIVMVSCDSCQVADKSDLEKINELKAQLTDKTDNLNVVNEKLKELEKENLELKFKLIRAEDDIENYKRQIEKYSNDLNDKKNKIKILKEKNSDLERRVHELNPIPESITLNQQ